MQPITAIIPNYTGKHLLEKHLSKVLATLRPGDELILFDDCSIDNSVQWLVKNLQLTAQPSTAVSLPEQYNLNRDLLSKIGLFVGNQNGIEIRVIASTMNVRFAQAVNCAVLFAQHNLLFILNNDVEPEPGCIDQLLSSFADPNIFAVGCKEYSSLQKTDASGKNKLWFEKGMFIHSKDENLTSGETAWVSGGSGLFNKKKWLSLKGFDLDFYPAYWEDVDLSYRAKKQGWKVLFNADAIVYHLHETTNATVFGQETINQMSWKHAELFVKKHATFQQKIQHYIWKPYWLYKRSIS